jgi:site-specific DNA-adenine methylase
MVDGKKLERKEENTGKKISTVYYSLTASAKKESRFDILGIDSLKKKRRKLYQLLFFFQAIKPPKLVSARKFNKALSSLSISRNNLSAETHFHILARGYTETNIAEAANIKKIHDGIKLIHGDFRENLMDPKYDNSIDLIYTDPPYAEEFLYLYNDVGRLAARTLKEGASLFVYCPQLHFQQRVSRILEGAQGVLGEHLYWMICIRHNGSRDRMWPKQVFVEWKPLVWFVKGGKLREGYDYIPDFIGRPRPDKDLDEWTQSTVDADHVIRRLTVENQIVLDPMMGTGTTGEVAVSLGRQFIGIDDSDRFQSAEARIKKAIANKEAAK